MSKKFTIKTTIIILTLAFVLGGCSLISVRKNPPKPPVQPPTGNAGGRNGDASGSISDQLAAQTKIKKFANYEELKEFLEEGSGGYGSYGAPMSIRQFAIDEMVEFNMPMVELESKQSVSPLPGLVGSQNYSTTNIQVEGVDEPDIIKTDGKYIYAVSGNNLFIVDAYPAAQANILSKIAFKSRPQDIYVNGDSLIVFGQNNNIRNTEIYKELRRRSNYTFFKVFDIKDRKSPKQRRGLDFEGSYSNSRMIGDYVYFITSNRSYYQDDEVPLPIIIQNEEIVLNKCDVEKCVMPPVYYFDIPYNNYNFTTITAINVKNSGEDINSEVYMLSGNQNMYVSQNNIYITYTKYISEYQLQMEVMREIIYPRLSVKDQGRIQKIEAVDNYILSRAEKTQKVSRILVRYSATLIKDEEKKLREEVEAAMKNKYQDIAKELEKTVIHKIAVSKGKLEYKTFGEVTGQALNQFSMDERDGYFRIATTKNRRWSRFAEDDRQESYSNLYVLDENLKVVGALEGLAKGEKIYSVRFMQGRAYMVTFRQTDPLFVIDLKDPKNPKVLGKLKIPGFSNYMHPYDENTLIGIGKETGESEWGGVITRGIKLSLFDVSDVANPKEIDKYELGDRGSNSIALSDHKAFLFSRDKNLLVIPVSIRESKDGSSYGELVFAGAAVFKVNKTGFELKGKIDHSDEGKEGESESWRRYDFYGNTVKRSLYIDDVLYTFSSKYLKMNKISDLEPVKNLELKKEKSGSDDDFKVVN